MPKRKRSVEEAVQTKLEKYRIDIFRAISSAKAAERKRFGIRLRESGIPADKKARLEREYGMLKTLDLRQVARNHLHSNLLRIKAVEASDDLPKDLRAGVPRSTLSPEEITLHNNVISVLCNTGPARQALDRAVADICETLGVPVAEKSKRVRKNKRKDAEDQPSDRIASPEVDEENDDDNEKQTTKHAPKRAPKPEESGELSGEESDFEGFSDDDDDDDDDNDEPETAGSDLDGLGESDEEGALSKYANLLGASSDEEDEFDEEFLAKYRGKEQVNLDDISLSGSASDVDEFDIPSDAESAPPLEKKVKEITSGNSDKIKEDKKAKKAEEKEAREARKNKKAAKAAEKATKTGNSAFLPTLMGGYISGSESASDIDEPPQKKRRGQRARQAIWEKKYGASAKHLQKPAAAKGGRDSGWDMKRGAVGPEDQGKGKLRKKGGRDSRGGQVQEYVERRKPEPKPTKKDNEGPLHPSWEARKKAKDAEKGVAFTGQKIVFD
ncbi:hypothetical protein PT974_03615 [Cladobotryum mycophilum]|uniref:Bud22 domain-containing protein n=1 Tax=Cladobotryum mycophilum TaxID=491253 RepID=A0ABR0SSU7_9HYPO